MKRWFLILLGLLVVVGCVPTDVGLEETAVPPTFTPMSTHTPFATLDSAVTVEIMGTAVLTEQPVPSPPGSTLELAYPPPPIQATPPYPGPLPNTAVTRIAPTPTPTIAIQPINDCASHPVFSRCGGLTLTGKLAYFSVDGQLTVLDFDTETAWVSTQTNLRDVDWSPAGDRLLAHDNSLTETYFYHQNGSLMHSETIGWVKWKGNGNDIQAGSYFFNDDYSIAVTIVTVEAPDTTGGGTHPDRQLQVEFYRETERKVWPLNALDYRYDVVAILGWVPGTEWILVGYGHGGVATRMLFGYRLMAVNVRSGEIVDSGLFVPGMEQIAWHPSETGRLLTIDLGYSEIGGFGALAIWQVPENQSNYLLDKLPFVRSPVWSPDGRYIAYTSYDPATETRYLMVLDTETGAAEVRAERGEFPAWSKDGNMIFYLELDTNSNVARIMAVGREKDLPLFIAESRFPNCPGVCLPRTAFDYTP